LAPFSEEFSFLIENLNSAVGAICYEEPSCRIHGKAVRRVEFTGAASLLAPGLDEFSVLGQFNDACIRVTAMTVCDENRAVRRDQNGGWPIEWIRTITCNARLAQSHQKSSIRAEFHHGIALAVLDPAVRHPYVVVAIDEESMGIIEHAGTEARNQL